MRAFRRLIPTIRRKLPCHRDTTRSFLSRTSSCRRRRGGRMRSSTKDSRSSIPGRSSCWSEGEGSARGTEWYSRAGCGQGAEQRSARKILVNSSVNISYEDIGLMEVSFALFLLCFSFPM